MYIIAKAAVHERSGALCKRRVGRSLRHLCHGLGMRRFLVEGLVIYYVVRAREADGAGSLDKRLDQEGG